MTSTIINVRSVDAVIPAIERWWLKHLRSMHPLPRRRRHQVLRRSDLMECRQKFHIYGVRQVRVRGLDGSSALIRVRP